MSKLLGQDTSDWQKQIVFDKIERDNVQKHLDSPEVKKSGTTNKKFLRNYQKLLTTTIQMKEEYLDVLKKGK